MCSAPSSNWNLRADGSVPWRANALNPDARYRFTDYTIDFINSGSCNCGCDGGMSWAGALLTGGITAGLTALGLWAMSRFSRGKSHEKTPQLSLEQQAYLQGYNSYKPTVSSYIPIITTSSSTTSTVTPGNTRTQTPAITTVTPITISGAKKPTSLSAVATRNNNRSEDIIGKNNNVHTNNSKQGHTTGAYYSYPIVFVINDTTNNTTNGNVYKFELIGVENQGNKNTEKPIYQCTASCVVVKNGVRSHAFTSNIYTLDRTCFEYKDEANGVRAHATFKDEAQIKMTTTGEQYTQQGVARQGARAEDQNVTYYYFADTDGKHDVDTIANGEDLKTQEAFNTKRQSIITDAESGPTT